MMAPITHACAVFLSRHRIYPRDVSSKLAQSSRRGYSHGRRYLQLQGRSWDCLIEGGDHCNDVSLECHPRSANALLKVSRERYMYREHATGLADLVLFDRHLPQVVCLGVERDRYGLTQLMEHDGDPFYMKDDPLVRRLRNATRLGRAALVFTLVPTWAEAHWDYTDGRASWLD